MLKCTCEPVCVHTHMREGGDAAGGAIMEIVIRFAWL